MKIFKSPTRRRAEKLRHELTMESVNLQIMKTKYSTDPQSFYAIDLQQFRLKLQISIIDKILEK